MSKIKIYKKKNLTIKKPSTNMKGFIINFQKLLEFISYRNLENRIFPF
jgi:hypothetical protein